MTCSFIDVCSRLQNCICFLVVFYFHSFLFIKYSWVITYLYMDGCIYKKWDSLFQNGKCVCIINYRMEEIYREILLRTPFQYWKIHDKHFAIVLSNQTQQPTENRKANRKTAMVRKLFIFYEILFSLRCYNRIIPRTT